MSWCDVLVLFSVALAQPLSLGRHLIGGFHPVGPEILNALGGPSLRGGWDDAPPTPEEVPGRS